MGKSSTPCAWRRCDNAPMDGASPLCIGHLHEMLRYLEGRNLTETREEANARAKRDAGDDRRERLAQRVRATRGDHPGWIYYLRIGRQVKVGYTTDITKRMRQYPPGSPLLAVHPGTPTLERELHQQFRGSLMQGREWFRPDPELLEHCEKVRAMHGDPSRFEHHARDPYATRQAVMNRSSRGVPMR